MLPQVMAALRYYIGENGRSPFSEWLARLDAQAAAKVTTALIRLELGNVSNVKAVGSGVAEIRIDWGPGYRVYFGRDGESLVILLTGGTKRQQDKDIKNALELWSNYKRRRKA